MQFVVSTKENSRLRACKYTYCMIYNSVYYSVLIYCVAWIGETSIPSTFYLSIWYNVLLLQLNLYLFQFHRFIYNTTYIYIYIVYIYMACCRKIFFQLPFVKMIGITSKFKASKTR